MTSTTLVPTEGQTQLMLDSPMTDAEQAQLERLKLKASQWQEAQRLRQYIEAVEHSAAQDGQLNEKLSDWLSWARVKADCIDPLIAVSDIILDSPEPKSPGPYY